MNLGTFPPTGVVRSKTRCAVADHRAAGPPAADGYPAARPHREHTAAGEGPR